LGDIHQLVGIVPNGMENVEVIIMPEEKGMDWNLYSL
jgi:hypothetical protein